jgi:FkbM family methyltransferase
VPRNLLRRRPRAVLSGSSLFISHLVQVLDQRRVSLVLDVGANRGQFAGQLRDAGYRGRIVSFEPLGESHRLLVEAARNESNWNVAPPMALGSIEELRPLQTFQRTDMSSLLQLAETGRQAFPRLALVAAETVQVRRLDMVFDGIVRSGEIVFLKIDTQGSELAVLEGASGRIGGIVGIQVEAAMTPIYVGQPSWLDVVNMVSGLGFEPVLISPGYFSKQIARQIDVDIVFMRPS